ncbi:hypothetical protein N8770_00455 [Candidatus Pelagibacter ubique]|jgi:hypothetical protein|nr:hypothetical protein [Candidatus Pelagibacter ubique]
MKRKYSARFKVSKSRKSKLGKTKPNFNKMVKEQCKRYEQSCENKIGETKPNLDAPTFNIELKKIEKINVNNDHENELDKYQEQKRLEREAYIKKEREEKNTIKFEVVTPIRKDPNRGMKFVKCNNDPINRGKLGHSKTFLKDIKKDRGYY